MLGYDTTAASVSVRPRDSAPCSQRHAVSTVQPLMLGQLPAPGPSRNVGVSVVVEVVVTVVMVVVTVVLVVVVMVVVGPVRVVEVVEVDVVVGAVPV